MSPVRSPSSLAARLAWATRLRALASLLEGEMDDAVRTRLDRPNGLWRHRLPEALARLLSPVL